MRFCKDLQSELSRCFPEAAWRVEVNPDPDTSVFILSQGDQIPGEFLITLEHPAAPEPLTQIVRGQTYCDFLNGGGALADFARDAGGQMLAQSGG